MLPAATVGIALVLRAIGNSQSQESTRSSLEWILRSPWVAWCFALGVIAAVAIAVFQTVAAYRKHTYDPTWVLKYQDKFDAMEEKERPIAARLLLNGLKEKDYLSQIGAKRKELSDIDPVLDFFEDLGFYVKGVQISPEVAHHHFYHWIRGYYQASRDYIDPWRDKEPARWEHLAYLFEITFEVEKEIEKRIERETGRRGGQQENLEEFLLEEIGESHEATRSLVRIWKRVLEAWYKAGATE